MRNKFVLFVLTLALAFGTLPTSTVRAQVPSDLQYGQDVGGYVSGVTTATGSPILIKYIGNSPNGGTVAVDASTGDITLKTGIVGSSTADATTECPVSGALGGVIDVSDAACNTLGEVVDAINASLNWRAVIQDGLRSDSSDTLLNTLSETQANVPAGVPLKIDGVAVDYNTIALIPVRDDIRFFLQEKAPDNAGSAANVNGGINKNPFNDTRTFYRQAFYEVTGTGALAAGFNVYSVKGNYSRPALAVASTAASIVGTSTETVTTLLTLTPAATTVAAVDSIFATYGLGGRPGASRRRGPHGVQAGRQRPLRQEVI
jgi:hypothetical protein